MKNKTGHISREALNSYFPEPALNKLADFCSAHSLLKSDEELSRSFESFFVSNHVSLDNGGKDQLFNDFEALEEVLPVLYELGEKLVVEGNQHEAKEIPQADSGNHCNRIAGRPGFGK